MYTVYQHRNKINNKVYIGITQQALEKRWGINGTNYKSSPHFFSAIQKYGWDNFEHNILFTGRTFTEEHKQKLSEAAKKRHVPCSEEKKKTLSKNYPHKKAVYCEELDIVFESVQECGRQLGASATNISKVCRGKGKTVKGYHLRYYE